APPLEGLRQISVPKPAKTAGVVIDEPQIEWHHAGSKQSDHGRSLRWRCRSPLVGSSYQLAAWRAVIGQVSGNRNRVGTNPRGLSSEEQPNRHQYQARKRTHALRHQRVRAADLFDRGVRAQIVKCEFGAGYDQFPVGRSGHDFTYVLSGEQTAVL